MHKITKGLKKKKKGKKSKHKEEELFKPEELEAYRREHQQQQQPAEATEEKPAPTGNDEWKKFNALTAGIDSFLKKTQDDLDRIKSTSFFQRVPPPSELKKEKEAEASEVKVEEEAERERQREEAAASEELGIVQVSESESEEEDEEDIFDTAYIDAIAAGEVKLAYIPESPTEQPEGDDPFDTSIAERAILGPAVTRKGKKLVPLGAAVEVLTGRVQAPTCVPIKRPSTRRTVLKERDLLLGSFDDNANSIADNKPGVSSPEHKSSLLDDDAPLPLSDEPIDLSKTLHQILPTPIVEQLPGEDNSKKNILEEFDVIAKAESPIEDDDDKEFALLAAESLSKTPAVALLPTNVATEAVEDNWNAFGEDKNPPADLQENGEAEGIENDPFDTTFAENVVPGKFELKIIENEILSTKNDLDFNPRAEDKLKELIKSQVSIQVINPAGQKELERISESDLKSIQPQHRDLLGGSITDLSNLGDLPLKPKEQIDENYIEYCDPFDTTIVETATAPGQAELKFLEKELLSDINVDVEVLSDDDFDPRADEIQDQQHFSRKASSASLKTVNFTLPLPEISGDLFALGEEGARKTSKPLTPYYVRENSVPEELFPEDELDEADPFDTSYVPNIAPGKAELKVIEKELFQSQSVSDTLTDQDFDPRDEKQVAVAKVVQTIKEISDKPKKLSFQETNQIDLLAVDNEVTTKVLTPAPEKSLDFEDISYVDPFDTSIASNILPGKAELKLLETELIHSAGTSLKRVLTDPDFNPRDSADENKNISKEVPENKTSNIPNLLEQPVDTVAKKPLTPVTGLEIGDDNDDIDPFDTSIANNIGPGQTELKLLESELI